MTPPVVYARMRSLTTEKASVGPPASRRANSSAALCSSPLGTTRSITPHTANSSAVCKSPPSPTTLAQPSPARGDPLNAAGERNDAESCLGQAEHGALGCPDQIAEQRELKAAGHAGPVHRRESRKRHPFDAVAEINERADHRPQFRGAHIG